MKLFKLDLHTHQVIIDEEALILKPFKALVDRDETEDKRVALAELSFVWFFTDFKSSYLDITEEEDRIQAVMGDIPYLPEGWQPDELVFEAIAFYRKRSYTIGMELLEAGKVGVQKIINWFHEVDLNEREERTNKFIHDVSKIQKTIKEIPGTLRDLRAAEKEVQLELTQKSQLRGSGEKKPFEDGIKFGGD